MKNIEWKQSNIDYDKLNEISHQNLIRIENGKNSVISGQLKDAAKKGGDKMGQTHFQNKTGLFGRSKNKIKSDLIKAGKATTSLPIWKDISKKGGTNSAKLPTHPNNVKEKCIHCGFETTLPLIRRWHNDNCKHKK